MTVTLIKSPNADDMMLFKRCIWITDLSKRGKTPLSLPSSDLTRKVLRARHSPIRVLQFAFLIEGIPSNIATHLCRHVHAQPFVSSLRNDRQDVMDGDKAPRDTPVDMIYYVNAEELQIIANKRLCMKASPLTRQVVQMMCDEVVKVMPEFDGLLVADCIRHSGTCYEIQPCGRWD